MQGEETGPQGLRAAQQRKSNLSPLQPMELKSLNNLSEFGSRFSLATIQKIAQPFTVSLFALLVF